MKVCGRCGKDNPDENVNCARCGSRLDVVAQPDPAAGQEPEHICYKHKNEKTELACGRCGRYLCHRCVVLGPAGPRCRDCAKQDISLRPAAIVHEAKVGTRNIFRTLMGGGLWGWFILISIIGGILGLFRSGCSHSENLPPEDRAALEQRLHQKGDAHEEE